MNENVPGFLAWLWDRFLAMFRRKPKELPASAETQLEGELRLPEQSYYSGLDELDRMVLSLDNDKVEFERITREKILKGDYFKKAFTQQMEYVRQPTNNMIIMNDHLNLNEKEFHIFSEEFIKTCHLKGIVCDRYTNTSVLIGMKSFLAYVQQCKERVTKSPTITTSEYR